LSLFRIKLFLSLIVLIISTLHSCLVVYNASSFFMLSYLAVMAIVLSSNSFFWECVTFGGGLCSRSLISWRPFFLVQMSVFTRPWSITHAQRSNYVSLVCSLVAGGYFVIWYGDFRFFCFHYRCQWIYCLCCLLLFACLLCSPSGVLFSPSEFLCSPSHCWYGPLVVINPYLLSQSLLVSFWRLAGWVHTCNYD